MVFKKMKNLSKRKNTFFNFKFWKSILVKPKSKVCNFQNPNSNDITVGLIRRQWKLHHSWWLHYKSLLVMQWIQHSWPKSNQKNHSFASLTRWFFLDYFFGTRDSTHCANSLRQLMTSVIISIIHSWWVR